MKKIFKGAFTTVAIGALLATASFGAAAQSLGDGPVIAPRSEGVGPYKRLILRGAYMIDGTGAPAQGPVDIVVENDRIVEVRIVGAPKLPIKESKRPKLEGGTEIDMNGMYIMPGFIDSHLHLHNSESGQKVDSEYVLKLWLSHGITTGRTVGGASIEWEMKQKRLLDENKLTGPRLQIYPSFGTGSGPINTPKQARDNIRKIKKLGGSGVKFFGAPEDILWAALDEADKLGLNSTMHHAQKDVMHANVLTTSDHGLKSMEHWYGLPEAMFEDKQIQRYPNDYIYDNEMNRFGEAGRLWKQAAKPGSDKWNEVMDTLLERDFVLSPTFVAYLTTRDFMRMSRAKWHEEYTMPNLWEFYRPNRDAHGSFWFDWTLKDENDWKQNFKLWMTFVNEYKNRGGKVIVGSDSGYLYNLYGFGFITEMQLLNEAGFSPLEVIHAATSVASKVLGIDDEVGTIRVGKKADFVVTKENPLQNMHVLLGTGNYKLNDETQKVERVGGIKYVVKDGIVYDNTKLLKNIRDMVQAEKDKLGIKPGIMPISHDENE
jgi:imidazolonepropionase-like amidohydrolase